MDTSTNVILEDPDNYSKARGILERLMITLGKTKRELMELEKRLSNFTRVLSLRNSE